MKIKIADEEFEVKNANTFWTRFKGLMGVKSLPMNGGLLLTNCSSIHCMFMRILIDVVYINKHNEILEFETVKPWRVGKFVKGAKHVLELHEGVFNNQWIGECIEVIEK